MTDPPAGPSPLLPLDRVDLRILHAVQLNGAISNVELAAHVHLSASQCARRLERLRRDGYIDRVVTLLKPEMFGLNILVHTMISLRTHELSSNEAFRRFVRQAPEILECYAQTGDADFFMKIMVKSLGDLSELFDRLLLATGGVVSMRSGVVMTKIKETTAIPLGRAMVD